MKGIQILKQYLQVWFVAFSEREFIVISGLSTVMEAIGRFPILIFLSLSLNRFSWEGIPLQCPAGGAISTKKIPKAVEMTSFVSQVNNSGHRKDIGL